MQFIKKIFFVLIIFSFLIPTFASYAKKSKVTTPAPGTYNNKLNRSDGHDYYIYDNNVNWPAKSYAYLSTAAYKGARYNLGDTFDIKGSNTAKAYCENGAKQTQVIDSIIFKQVSGAATVALNGVITVDKNSDTFRVPLKVIAVASSPVIQDVTIKLIFIGDVIAWFGETGNELDVYRKIGINGSSNQLPVISSIPNQTISENTATAPTNTGALPFTISDPVKPASELTVSATSSNPTLIPNGNLVLGGSAGSRTITATPNQNQTGVSTITVTVSNGTLTASKSFLLTVNKVNTAATISAISDQIINKHTSSSPVIFNISDDLTAPDSLFVSATSSNQSIIMNGDIALGGSGANRNIIIKHKTGSTIGACFINVSVKDAGGATTSRTFKVTINNNPTISVIPNKTLLTGASTGAIAFTIEDDLTPTASLVLLNISSNKLIIPSANITLGGSDSSRTVTVTAPNGVNGNSNITIKVTDAYGLTASTTFNVIVNAPTAITTTASEFYVQRGKSITIPINIKSPSMPVNNLILQTTSDEQDIIKNSDIITPTIGTIRNLVVKASSDKIGEALVTVKVDNAFNIPLDIIVNVLDISIEPINVLFQKDTKPLKVNFLAPDGGTVFSNITLTSSKPSVLSFSKSTFNNIPINGSVSPNVVVNPNVSTDENVTITVNATVAGSSTTLIQTINLKIIALDVS